MRRFSALVLLAAAALSGCDMLGIESASAVAARKEAEGKAIGAACRHAGRAIEDCYALNKRADKAAVFAGWREMNDYMRENNIDTVRPQAASKAEGEAAGEGAADDASSDKPARAAKAGKAGQGGTDQES